MAMTILAWLMIAVFMFVVMTKKLSPLTALCAIPLVFAAISLFIPGSPAESWTDLGTWVMDGLGTTANTGILLLFAILYFSIMLDAGLFDPITKKMIEFAKGDPMKVLIATAVVAAAISMNGDGTTTTLVCCAAFLPIYEKLGMKKMNLAVLVILQNTVMNLLPWGGPTARAMAVTEVGGDILSYLMPGMIISVLFNIFVVARHMGKQERARLGVHEFTQAEIDELTNVTDEEVLAIRRPQNWWFNAIMTVVLIAWLVAGSFIEAISLPNQMLFMVGTVLALLVNYPNLKDQSKRIGENGGDAVQVVILIFGAGIFMGLFQGSGMADALAQSLITIIPKQLAGFWGLIVALVSAPGTFFISNDGFYFGVMPALAEAGYVYGFTNLQMALASLMGQAFHLLSPLTAFIYLLLRLTEQDLGEWQRAAGKWAACIFVIFVVTIMATGALPFYIPQA
ncbi:MAG: CitMHS family transporter [Collinsella phocaeensis]|uniref:CitMHS family transporter n=1 Tax=Collinsella phocaeensis TaxID=1871016 RepID=UPI00093071B4|nr:citrate:proton symporter [Collinsella phocaeensis]MBS7157413.1 citrate:proton symporter [Collinsella sp.]